MVPGCVSLLIALLWTFGVWIVHVQSYDAMACNSYLTIENDWRFPGQNDTHHCDNHTPGWYVFKMQGVYAEIPTQCIQDYTCGGKVSMHVDLEGKNLPAIGESVDAKLCGSFNVLDTLECCVLQQSITIQRCAADILIYNLNRIPACPAVICTVKVTEQMPSEYLAKPGDRPLSAHRAPSTSTPQTASTTNQEFVRTMVPYTFSTTNSGPDASSTGSTVMNPTPYISSSVTPPVNRSTSDSNVTEPEDASSTAFASNGTLDNNTSTDISSPYTTISQNSTETVSSATNITEDDQDFETDKSASQSNATENPAVATNTSETAGQPDDLTTITLTSAFPDASIATSPTPKVFSSSSRGPSSSHDPRGDQFGPATVLVRTTASSTSQVSADSTMVPSSPSHAMQAVRFWFTPILREDFVYQLVQFSKLLTENDTLISRQNISFKILEESHVKKYMYQDIYFFHPSSGDGISAKHVVDTVNSENFAEQLYNATNITLLMVCPVSDNCSIDDGDTFTKRPSLFERNRALFIAVIVMAALFLLGVLGLVYYLRNRRQGTWVLAADHDEKDPEHLAIDSPMTDVQILHGERGGRAGTPLTANGRDGAHTPDDIPAADEDNGWVVPIDQAPPPHAPDGTATKTEDTQF